MRFAFFFWLCVFSTCFIAGENKNTAHALFSDQQITSFSESIKKQKKIPDRAVDILFDFFDTVVRGCPGPGESGRHATCRRQAATHRARLMDPQTAANGDRGTRIRHSPGQGRQSRCSQSSWTTLRQDAYETIWASAHGERIDDLRRLRQLL